MALAGCATNAQNKYADSSSRNLRDNYLSRTQSDPLGAYLNDESIIADSSHDSATRSPPTKALASTALRFLGIRYRYGGIAPKSGFDCSGLVAYAAEKSLGLKLPHRAAEMAHEGKSVPRDSLKKGDLVFFNTRGRRYSHVGIYLGDHKFVHAPRKGQVVRVESMDEAYWKKRYNGARRLAANDSPEKLAKEAHSQR
ncbi:MAG: NlpC/P60 family protein [Candidimonas sp.]|nr:MAG: NlpC/P60 family protein [Candidimonas sp.]TAM21497.1 MAG: NlpC/P60 family protein [Candidimonas sp.]TAM77864.1 MAG: NlpC/P60 family protein [Candidimonas sp.]